LASWFTATASPPLNTSNAYVLNTELAGGQVAHGTVTVAMTDANVNQDACANVTLSVDLNVA
jgi:hypothetical protein